MVAARAAYFDITSLSTDKGTEEELAERRSFAGLSIRRADLRRAILALKDARTAFGARGARIDT